MGLFKQGFNSVRQEQKRQEENRQKFSGKLFNFFLTDRNTEADIVFLHNQPLTFYGHVVEEHFGGSKRWNTYVCTNDSNCPYCSRGEKTSFKGAFLVYDKTIVSRKDKDGKEFEAEAGLRLYIVGSRVLGQLDRINSKYGLTNYVWNISRSGTGTSTQYMFDRGDDLTLTEKNVRDMLPDFMKDKFSPRSNNEDDIAESIIELLQEQCSMLVPNYGNDSADDEVEEEEEELASKPAKPVKMSLGKKFYKK